MRRTQLDIAGFKNGRKGHGPKKDLLETLENAREQPPLEPPERNAALSTPHLRLSPMRPVRLLTSRTLINFCDFKPLHLW